ERGAAQDQLERFAPLAADGELLEPLRESLRQLVEHHQRLLGAGGVGDERPRIDARGGHPGLAQPPGGLGQRRAPPGAELVPVHQRAASGSPAWASASRAARSASRELAIRSSRSPESTWARLPAL